VADEPIRPGWRNRFVRVKRGASDTKDASTSLVHTPLVVPEAQRGETRYRRTDLIGPLPDPLL